MCERREKRRGAGGGRSGSFRGAIVPCRLALKRPAGTERTGHPTADDVTAVGTQACQRRAAREAAGFHPAAVCKQG
jgi:hypothetical protein